MLFDDDFDCSAACGRRAGAFRSLNRERRTGGGTKDAKALGANAPFDRPHRCVMEVEGGEENIRTRAPFPRRGGRPSPRRPTFFARLLLLLLLLKLF